MNLRESISAPDNCTPRYTAGWKRGDTFVAQGGDPLADGPVRADEETWNGFVDALAAHRARMAKSTKRND